MASAEPDVAATILAMERAALERWGKGDPDGFLEISAAEVTYFDPFVAQRLDGIEALRRWYDQFRGKIQIARFEMIEPCIQLAGDAAVLTYRFDSYGIGGSMRWNTTELYRRSGSGWEIVHTHWAFYQPKIAL